MRDLETISTAITAAETGHLVFGTLHTTGSARTVDRIIDQFPPQQQEQIRVQLSVSLIAVISQVLMPRADNSGRIAAFEVMVMTPGIENHIRKNETFKIPSAIQTGRSRGMSLLDDHLFELYEKGAISREQVLPSARTSAGPRNGWGWPCSRESGVSDYRYARTKKLLGQILKEMKKVHEGMIQEALQVQREEGGQIGQILIRLGHIDDGVLQQALARQAGIEMIDLSSVQFTPELLETVDPETAKAFHVIPVRQEGGKLVVAVGNPQNTAVLDDLRFMTGGEVEGVMAPEEDIKRLVAEHYGTRQSTMEQLVDEVVEQVGGTPGQKRYEGVDLADQEAMANSPPVIKLLQYLLFQAIRDRASDVHLEPFEDDFKIRYRVDGALYELQAPPRHLALPLISRVKVMAGLDIAETRLPQDGRIEIMIGGRSVDLRVSTLPTIFGESCVIRILDSPSSPSTSCRSVFATGTTRR